MTRKTPVKAMSKPRSPHESTIGFTAKELFLEINRKLDDLTKITNLKVDRMDHEKLVGVVEELRRTGGDRAREAYERVQKVEDNLNELRTQTASSSAVNTALARIDDTEHATKLQWFGIAIGGIIAIIAAVIGLIPHH